MIILAALLILLGLICGLYAFLSKSDKQQPVEVKPTCATCNGEDSRCEQECMMEAATKKIEYYDDEELDRFADRPADSYNDDEVEEFSDIMYTLKPHDVAGWNRSLILRRINIPNQLKDELIALLEQ